MLDEIRAEIERVVGPAGVNVRLQSLEEGEMLAIVETAEAVCSLPAPDLLECLRKMPDRAGVLALREALEREIYHPSTHLVEGECDPAPGD